MVTHRHFSPAGKHIHDRRCQLRSWGNPSRRLGTTAIAAALAAGTALGATQAASAAPNALSGNENSTATSTEHSVTLITGDRVLVRDGATSATVQAGKGREGTTFSTFHTPGHLYVVPVDAMALLGRGKLDRGLFDVTALVDAGYDDAKRDSLPLIVTHSANQPLAANTLGASITRDLPAVHGSAMVAAKSNAGSVWQALTGHDLSAGIDKVWLDGMNKPSLDRSVPQIGAPIAWQAGYTGTGVKVAVLDTGIDATHPDLAGKIAAEQNFSPETDTLDHVGHGTHVASTIAGTGAKSGGRFKGVAPDATLLNGKVCATHGCPTSAIIAGMQWAADQGATIANLSLGGKDSGADDPLKQAVNTLSAQRGILFVIAAGNSGSESGTIESPGSAESALTVGAVDRDESLARFSSRGPRTGDDAIKPDITAPGVGIVAARSSTGTIGTPAEDGYVALSGTSMATPHVAGSAALLAQQHPDWKGTQLKAALTASAKPNTTLNVFQQGSGRVDVGKAISENITTEPTNLSLPTQPWPHTNDKPVSKTVTYHNTGKTDTTLSLAIDGTGPDGKPAPAGLFSVNTDKITIPAGGQTQVTVTANTKAGNVDGPYSGTLIATSDTSTTRTPVAITREAETYTLTVHYTGFDGKPTATGYGALFAMRDLKFTSLYDPSGTVSVRLPKGDYLLDNFVTGANRTDPVASLPAPGLSITKDTTIDADARLAKQIKVTPPDPTLTLSLGEIGYSRKFSPVPGQDIGGGVITGDLSKVYTAQVGPALPDDQLGAVVNTQWSQATPTPSPSFYRLAWTRHGTAFTGIDKTVTMDQLAKVHYSFGPAPAGSHAAKDASPVVPGGFTAAGAAVFPVSMPGTATEYVTTEDVQWNSGTTQISNGSAVFLNEQPKSYQAGRTYHERLNYGVFGPTLPTLTDIHRYLGVSRVADTIAVDTPLFGDSSGAGGDSSTDTASTALFHGDTKIGESTQPGSGRFAVPAEAGDYRLTTEATRSGVSDVSTRVSATWTFSSSHVDGAVPTQLPISVVRFDPELDDNNAAHAGQLERVPLSVRRQPGAPQASTRQLSLEVSYDDGTNWVPAPVLGDVALVWHPFDANFVSLRAKATSSDGSTVEETVIRAYKLTKSS
ncbi:S8 family serine peptidase [Solihabitans fulvus]|uniref:S8 family serine peptidase n=1 Tax=Solihabitans fulvus TaxID=1892852 RepID=A0A5B2WQW5_9PSEU|nr:S8 family serine peptidase [Solihabitans fulvus]KAA2253364.1 S8 family serine peptidase [Solihabitans fulvus]